MSVWNPENVRDVAESVGMMALSDDVAQNLARDVEFRLSQVLEEALKAMRHGKKTTLSTQDVSQALRALDAEPLYGYESTRPLRFGEATLGPGQPLFYVEDDEMDLEKLINAPLPKVPRDMSFTAHWLAVEGVQPTIPQNPTTAETRNQDLHAKGAGVSTHAAGLSTGEDVAVKPLVKHVLSKELQLYFERVCGGILDESHEEIRTAALTSLRHDPGLHQLVPYFVQFVAEKVAHSLRHLFVLTQMVHLTSALLENESLYLDPYAASIVPPVLTCLIGRRLGDQPAGSAAPYQLREMAAALIGVICNKYSGVSPTLKPRLARTCLKHFLDPTKPMGVHFGAVLGLQAVGGTEAIRALILPNLRAYEVVLVDRTAAEEAGSQDDRNNVHMDGQDGDGADPPLRPESGTVIGAVVRALMSLESEGASILPVGSTQAQPDHTMTNGEVDTTSTGTGTAAGTSTAPRRAHAHDDATTRQKLREKLGPVFGSRIYALDRPRLWTALLSEQ